MKHFFFMLLYYLLISATFLLGAYLLDLKQEKRIKEIIDFRISKEFSTFSVKKGMWYVDHEKVCEEIGIEPEDLPSYGIKKNIDKLD
jgi:uncharacterized protein (DUF486 family)